MRGDSATPNPPLGHTTIPNILFDLWLPTLSDCELRVLLVVARSTLGWKAGNGRKERDWLSHSQLRRRTGRSSTPVSRALDTLVNQGLLEVQTEAGELLLSSKQRQMARSRLYFRLGTALLGPEHSKAHVAKCPVPLPAPQKNNLAAQITSDILPNGFHWVETTKETGTKSVKEEVSFPAWRITESHGESTVHQTLIKESNTLDIVPVDEQARRVCASFQSTYEKARPGEPMPEPHEDDLARLRSYVERGYADALEMGLPTFFACSFGFVRRRQYSLQAYLDCFFVLQTRKNGNSKEPRKA